jgi:hypothetical protein
LILVLLVAISEDVGTLDSLGEEAEDVVDNENGLLCIGWTGGVWNVIRMLALVESNSLYLTGLEAIDFDVFTPLLVAFAHDWWNGAAFVTLD